MPRRPGPLDRGERIDTLEILSAIEADGKYWPARMAHYTIEAVSNAIGREIMAGTLTDGSELSLRGKAELARLRSAVGQSAPQAPARREHAAPATGAGTRVSARELAGQRDLRR